VVVRIPLKILEVLAFKDLWTAIYGSPVMTYKQGSCLGVLGKGRNGRVRILKIRVLCIGFFEEISWGTLTQS
jgi:hypothetical protein